MTLQIEHVVKHRWQAPPTLTVIQEFLDRLSKESGVGQHVDAKDISIVFRSGTGRHPWVEVSASWTTGVVKPLHGTVKV